MSEFDLTHSNGINMNYLSPSTINSFIERRPQWYKNKVEGAKFQAVPAMARGTAVEHAINVWLATGQVEGLDEVAKTKYDLELEDFKKSCSTAAKEQMDKLRDTIPGLVEVAFNHFDNEFVMNKPQTQTKITCRLPGVQREVLGYLDFFRPGFAVDDCKVSAKSPSGLSQGYIIQGALYRLATGVPVNFHYIIDNKTPIVKVVPLTDDDYVFGISYATEAAKVLEELEVCESPKRIMKLMSFPNLSSYFTFDEKKEAAKEYGIKF